MKRIKKTCWDCRALRQRHGWIHVCDLGYQIKDVKINNNLYEPRPAEVCPKPKTWSERFNATPKPMPNKGAA